MLILVKIELIFISIFLVSLILSSSLVAIIKLKSNCSLAFFSEILPLGVALLILTNSFLLKFINGHNAEIIITTILMIIVAIRISSLCYDIKRVTNFFKFFITSNIIFLIISIPIVLIGSLVPIEGTPNHDDIWYVYSAKYLLTNSLYDHNIATPDYAFLHSASLNIRKLPRIGAESFVVYFSSLLKLDPYRVYPVTNAFGVLLLGIASASVLKDIIIYSKNNVLWLIFIFSFLPIPLFIYANNNFATLYGETFFLLCYYSFIKFMSYTDEGLNNGARFVVFFGALVITYPEFFVILMPAIFIIILCNLYFDGHKLKFKNNIFYITCLCSIMIILVFFEQIITVYKTISASSSNADAVYMHEFDWQTAFYFVFTLYPFCNSFIPERATITIFGLAIAASLLAANKKITSNLLPAIFVSFSMLIFFAIKGSGYSFMKSIEMGSSMVNLILISAQINLFEYIKNNFIKRFSFLYISIIMAVMISMLTISIYRIQNISSVSSKKHINDQLESLAELKKNIPPNAVLIFDWTGPNDFMVSRWVAYFLPDVRLIFSPNLHEGGYIEDLKTAYSLFKNRVTHVLTNHYLTSNSFNGVVEPAFSIITVSNGYVIYGDGFYRKENWGRWMSKIGTIEIFGDCASSIVIKMQQEFMSSVLLNFITINFQDGSFKKFKFIPTEQVIVKLPQIGQQTIKFMADREAVSPKSVSSSEDNRMLTYGFGGIEIITDNACENSNKR